MRTGIYMLAVIWLLFGACKKQPTSTSQIEGVWNLDSCRIVELADSGNITITGQDVTTYGTYLDPIYSSNVRLELKNGSATERLDENGQPTINMGSYIYSAPGLILDFGRITTAQYNRPYRLDGYYNNVGITTKTMTFTKISPILPINPNSGSVRVEQHFYFSK